MIKDKSILTKFTVRVYGLCIQSGKVLLVEEKLNGLTFTKFPGGGLEFGEGLLEALSREIQEELATTCEITNHFYTSDFFQQSAFNAAEQLISVYYFITLKDGPSIEKFPMQRSQSSNHSLLFFWADLDEVSESWVTFPIDKIVVAKLKATNFN